MAIRKLAADLIDLSGLLCPPFDPEVLASYRGVTDVARVEMKSAGRLRPSAGGLIIEVNIKHTPGKQNLTINHETTHTLMATYGRRFVDDVVTGVFDRNGSEEEMLCDIGGAALLLDERWLRRTMLDVGPSLPVLTHTATLYRSSLQAAAWQLSKLLPWPCAFIFWEPGLRNAEKPFINSPMLPGFADLGRTPLKWRVTHAYPARTFQPFIPWNQSTNSELVCGCSVENPSTEGHAVFEFCDKAKRLYCQSVYAPYRDSVCRKERVISFVIEEGANSKSPIPTVSYQLESL
jgi:hypothetical protein